MKYNNGAVPAEEKPADFVKSQIETTDSHSDRISALQNPVQASLQCRFSESTCRLL